MGYAPLIALAGTASLGSAALLIKLLAPSREAPPAASAAQAGGVLLLWLAWLGLTRLPQSADGWTGHALMSNDLGLVLVCVWLLLIPVLLVTSALHARYFWRLWRHCSGG